MVKKEQTNREKLKKDGELRVINSERKHKKQRKTQLITSLP
jgi:ribosomal protein L36